MAPRELVLLSGTIVTLTDKPRPEALLIKGDRIAKTGTVSEVLAEASPDAERIDLAGRAVIPGFNDNHIHAVIMGDQMSALSLAGLDERGIIEALRERFRGAPPGTLLYAYKWDYPHAPHPHRRLLDEAFPDNPVYLAQFSGHGAWVNTQMLKRMGLRNRGGWRAPGVGEVLTDSRGEPSGIVHEAFENPYIQKELYGRWRRPEVIRSALETALPALAAAGVTTVQDNTWFPEVLPVLAALRDEGALTVRFSCWRFGPIPAAVRWMERMRHDDVWFHPGPVKYLADGAFSSRSAWLFEPYNDDPGTSGSGLPPVRLMKLFAPHLKKRRRIACHAIGDRAVASFCDAVEELSKRYPWIPELRLRIEHAQLVRRSDIIRMRELGLLAAVQPAALSSPEKDMKLIGPERARSAYPYRSFLEEGVPLSFGSDYPGEGLYAPLAGIALVVNREGEERLTAEQALRAYTEGSAYAEGREHEKGVIREGMYADLAVLSENPLEVPASRIAGIRVELTITGGRIVYRAASESGTSP